MDVLSGVPQGSVLGPLLFIIYINEIVHQISQRSYMNLFADDITLYRVINTADDYVQLQEDINAVSAFLTSKHLNLNTSKNDAVIFSSPRREHTQSFLLCLLLMMFH